MTAMTSEVERRIRAGGAVLAFDTNAAAGHRRLFGLCDIMERLKEASDPLLLHRCIPALAHAEMVFHLRHSLRGRNSPYSVEVVRKGLSDKGLSVEPFGVEDAEAAADFLDSQFTSPEAWRLAKRQRYVDALRLSPEDANRASGKRCAATVDWYIAAHVDRRGWILVTSDSGPEFQGVTLRINLSDLETLLTTLLAERTSPRTAS